MNSKKAPDPGGIEVPVETKPAVVLIAGLSRDTTESGVAFSLETFGVLLAIELDRDAKGRSRGMGNVTFASHQDAIRAIDSSDTLRIDDRIPRLRLRVDADPPQDSHDGWGEIRRRKSTPKVGKR